jgi:hypothetical protein
MPGKELPMRRIAVWIMVMLTASCQQEQAAPQPGKSTAAVDPTAPQPGRYRASMTVKAVSFPGMSAGTAQQARNLFGGTGQASDFCLTPEDAAKGREAFFMRAVEGDCRYDRFTAEAGKLAATLVCQTGKGMTARSELTGTFTAISSQVAIRTTSEVPGGPEGSMVLETEVATERLGECN